MSEQHYVSARADKVWQTIRERYLPKLDAVPNPPADFCKLIDAATMPVLKRVLGRMVGKHPTWPPTFGEFAALFAEADPQEHVLQQSIDWQQRLCEFTARLSAKYWHSWTPVQRRNWEYLGRIVPGEGVTFTGVRIPADPAANRPARIYTLEELPS